MRFERGKDPKDAIGIGTEAFLIKNISETLSKNPVYSDYKLSIPARPNNFDVKAEWIQPRTGYYFKLIKAGKDRLFRQDTKYSHYLEYDHGMHYGMMLVDDFIKK